MDAVFSVNIAVPGKVVLDKRIISLIVPAENGYLGVLAHHAPIVAKLRPGVVTIRDTHGSTAMFKVRGDGFLEFSSNKATLLLDSCEWSPLGLKAEAPSPLEKSTRPSPG